MNIETDLFMLGSKIAVTFDMTELKMKSGVFETFQAALLVQAERKLQ